MILNYLLKKQILTYLLFVVLLTIGLFCYKDYGLTIDDEHYRINGLFYYNYIKDFFYLLINYDLTELKILNQEIRKNPLSNHPAIFETILALFSDITNSNDTREIYNLSHLLNFSIYTLSLFFLYQIIFNRFKSYKIAIISILIIFLSPRFFAESFYNSRDIFFFSIFIFYLYFVQNLLRNHSIINLTLLALLSALLINSKILGIIPYLVFLIMYSIYVFEEKRYIPKYFTNMIIFILMTFSFMIILWPYLWASPFKNLINAYLDIISVHNNLEVLNLFSGDYLSSINTPWFYRIVWFLITTPLLVSLLFIFGLMILLGNIGSRVLKFNERNTNLWNNENEFFDFYIVITLIVTFFLTAKFNESQFGGWRHLYFLYAAIIYIFAYTYKTILSINKKFIKKLINILLFITLTYNSIWITANHPYQNNYFNIFINKYAKNNFDLDYWGLANFQSIKYILKNDNKVKINISTISFADLNTSLLKLNADDRKRVNIVYNYEKADYLINSYTKRIGKNYSINSDKFIKFNEILVNKRSINTIFKKK